jgi:hypothetical protein
MFVVAVVATSFLASAAQISQGQTVTCGPDYRLWSDTGVCCPKNSFWNASARVCECYPPNVPTAQDPFHCCHVNATYVDAKHSCQCKPGYVWHDKSSTCKQQPPDQPPTPFPPPPGELNGVLNQRTRKLASSSHPPPPPAAPHQRADSADGSGNQSNAAVIGAAVAIAGIASGILLRAVGYYARVKRLLSSFKERTGGMCLPLCTEVVKKCSITLCCGIRIMPKLKWPNVFQSFGLWRTELYGYRVSALIVAMTSRQQQLNLPGVPLNNQECNQGGALGVLDHHWNNADDLVKEELVRGIVHDLEHFPVSDLSPLVYDKGPESRNHLLQSLLAIKT